MGDVADAFEAAFRDYVIDGNSASGAHRPVKAEARALGETIEEGYVAPGRVITNPAAATSSGVAIWNESTVSGSYTFEGRALPGSFGSVDHHYSDAGPARQIDNVGNQAGLLIKLARNEGVRPGVTGTGAFLDFVGPGPGDGSGTIVDLGYLARTSDSLVFAGAAMPFKFIGGLQIVGSGSDAQTLLATSLNTTYAGNFSGQAFGVFIATALDSGFTHAIVKNGTGAGVMNYWNNCGTGKTLSINNDGAEVASISVEGWFSPNLPTYADNAAAATGSHPVGALYKTATGEVRVRV